MVFDRLLSSINGGDVLDVGCGVGQFTEILVKSLKSFNSVTGIDVDANSLEEARKKHHGPAFRFLQVTAEMLPFEEGCFNFVAISKALHHVEDPELTLMEMKRVLREGGYFLINEMHRDQLSDAQQSHVLYHHLRSEVDNLLGISHNHTFSRKDLLRLADGLGLRDRVMVEFTPDPGSAKDPARIEEFSRKMDGWLTWLEGHPSKKEIAAGVDTLKGRFLQVGICRPPQLVIFGKK
jgi:SAM-dependent methyltransferase